MRHIVTLAFYAALGACVLSFEGCVEPPMAPPPANITLPTDVPMPDGFAFADDQEAKTLTTEGGYRFQVYSFKKDGEYAPEAASRFFKDNLPAHGWKFVSEQMVSQPKPGWQGRWTKDRYSLDLSWSSVTSGPGDAQKKTAYLKVEIK